jgi:Replication-relaxation
MLLDGSPQAILRRLNLLYHHGFLDRLKEHSPSPMVYALGNKGAKVLERLFGISQGKIDWTVKNNEIDPVSLFRNHTLLVADFMVRLEAACKKRGDVKIIRPEEIVEHSPEETKERQNPLGWSVTVYREGEKINLGVVPDKIFGLHVLSRPEGRNKAYFFLEADRGTMPVMRKGLKQTSFFRKFLAYHETWQQELHTKLFNIKNFRVLTVTSTPERIKNMIAANREINNGEGSNLFLFTSQEAMETCENTFALQWRNGRDGKLVGMI